MKVDMEFLIHELGESFYGTEGEKEVRGFPFMTPSQIDDILSRIYSIGLFYQENLKEWESRDGV